MKTASETLTPVVLELGGKDAAVVFADADLPQVENVLMRGVYQNAGQNCIGIERVLVEKPVYESFLNEMEMRIKALRQGAPLGFGVGEEQADVGAMVLPQSIDKIQELVDEAVKKGARLLVGGKKYTHQRWPKVGIVVAWARTLRCSNDHGLLSNFPHRANTTRQPSLPTSPPP